MRTPPAVFTPMSRSAAERENEGRKLDDEVIIERAELVREGYASLMRVANTSRVHKVC